MYIYIYIYIHLFIYLYGPTLFNCREIGKLLLDSSQFTDVQIFQQVYSKWHVCRIESP